MDPQNGNQGANLIPAPDTNWHALHDEYTAFGGLLSVFCQHKSISVTIATKIFAAIDDEKLSHDKKLIVRELVNGGVEAAKNLRAKIGSDDDTVSLKASDSLLKHLALAPKVEPVALTDNRVQVNFFLPENGRSVRVPDAKVLGDGN